MASKTALTAFVFILIISRLSMADPIVQKQTFGGTPNISGVLAFNQFDESVGNLTSIQITLFLQSSGGRLILDNDNEYPVSGTLEFGAKGIISSTDVSLVNASSAYIPGEVGAYHSGTFNLAGNVGDVEGDYDPNAPDGLEYNGGIETDSKSDFVGEFAWDGYKGSGTYDIKYSITQWLNYGGIKGIEPFASPRPAVSGYVEVIYTYDPIPEPAAITLLSIGILAVRKKEKLSAA